MVNSQPKSDVGSVTNLKLVLLLLLSTANFTLSFRFNPLSQNEVENAVNSQDDYDQSSAPNENPDLLSTSNWNRGSSVQGYHPMGSNQETYQFTRKLLNNIAKRTAYAHSTEEIREQEVGMGIMHKRAEGDVSEPHWGGCTAVRDWRTLDNGYYPKHILSYNCTNNNCLNFGLCTPKKYVVKVLKRKIPGVSDEGCDAKLPDDLKCDWNLVSFNVTTYCQCVSGPLYG